MNKSFIAHWSIAFVIFFIAMLFWGCVPKIITEYKEVKIPTKCQMDMPSKPMFVENPVEMNLLILKYADELNVVLRSCK